MATFKHGIHGGFKGRVGNVVGSSWKGLDVMKIRPASVANPNTRRQRDQRSRFGLMARFLNAQRRLVRIGFRPYAVKMTPVNAAMSYNIAAALTGDYPDYSINYSKVLLSRGDLPGMTAPVLSFVDPLTVTLAWTDNSSAEGAHATDKLHVSIYHAETNKSLGFIACAERSDALCSLTIPAEWSARHVEVFTFFLAESGVGATEISAQLSDTAYAGSLELVQA